MTTIAYKHIISNMPSKQHALSNCVYVSPEDKVFLGCIRVDIEDFIFNVKSDPQVNKGSIALNSVQRRITRSSVGDTIDVYVYDEFTNKPMEIDTIYCRIAKITEEHIEESPGLYDYLEGYIANNLQNHVLSFGQQVAYNDVEHNNLRFIVTGMVDKKNHQISYGYVSPLTPPKVLSRV